MSPLVGWLSSNGATLSIVGAAVAFIVSTIQQFVQRRAEAAERDFQAFHRLIGELVSPDPVSRALWIDRQAAVIFELRLRRFKKYYEFTERTLKGLKENWTGDPKSKPRLIEEIDLTLAYIENHKHWWS